MAVTEARPAIPARTIASRRPASVLALASLEARSALRGPAFRFISVLALLVGWAVGDAPGRGVSLSAWAAGDAAWRYLGFIVIIWMSLAAVMDTVSRTEAIIFSKPQPTERLVLARFMAVYLQVLVVLAALFCGAILSRLYASGSLTGFPVYGLRFLVSAGVLFFTAAASYALALMARTPLAGAVVALAWVLTLAGKGFLAKALFPAYAQNLPTYILLGISLICFACWLFRRQRRGAAPAALWARLGGPIALVLSGLALNHAIRTGHDPLAVQQPALVMMSEQNATLGERAPGFRFPDGSGHLVSLADYPDRILVIALWSPNDPDSSLILSRLEEVYQRYGSRGVQPIAVCMSEDSGAAAAFSLGEGLHFPVVQDWSTHNADQISEMSSMTTAYRTGLLPFVAVTDRRRTLRSIMGGGEANDSRTLFQNVELRLKEEPE